MTFGKGGRRASNMNGANRDVVTAGQLFGRVGSIVKREEEVQDAQLGPCQRRSKTRPPWAMRGPVFPVVPE